VEAAAALEAVAGTVYEIGSVANVLCKDVIFYAETIFKSIFLKITLMEHVVIGHMEQQVCRYLTPLNCQVVDLALHLLQQ